MAVIGQPFGFLRPFSNRSVYNGLFRSFTASSNVRRTICGVCSTGIPPEWKLYTKLYTKSNRFAFPSLDNFNSFRKKNARILPSYIHIYIIPFIRKISASRRDHFFRNYLCSSPSQIYHRSIQKYYYRISVSALIK